MTLMNLNKWTICNHRLCAPVPAHCATGTTAASSIWEQTLQNVCVSRDCEGRNTLVREDNSERTVFWQKGTCQKRRKDRQACKCSAQQRKVFLSWSVLNRKLSTPSRRSKVRMQGHEWSHYREHIFSKLVHQQLVFFPLSDALALASLFYITRWEFAKKKKIHRTTRWEVNTAVMANEKSSNGKNTKLTQGARLRILNTLCWMEKYLTPKVPKLGVSGKIQIGLQYK